MRIRIGILGPAQRSNLHALAASRRTLPAVNPWSQFGRCCVEARHSPLEQWLGRCLQTRNVAEAIVFARNVDKVSPCALDRKCLVGKRRAISLDSAAGCCRQFHQTHLAQLSARIRAQDETSVRADAFVRSQRCYAVRVAANDVGVQRQIGQGRNACRPCGVSHRHGGADAQRQHTRMPATPERPVQRHDTASSSVRRACSRPCHAASGMTPRIGHGCARPQRTTMVAGE